VLVVAADEAGRDHWAGLLREISFAVETAEDGKAAQHRLGEDAYDLLVVDFSLPGMDGLTLLRRVHQRLDLPAIVMLDSPDNQTAVEAGDLGAQVFIKPIEPGLLQERAAHAVQAYRSPGGAFAGSTPPVSQRNQILMSATHAKNEFGRLLESVIGGATVTINKHDAPKAVVISVEDFEALKRAEKVLAVRAQRQPQIDAVAERMQSPRWREGMMAAWRLSPEELAEAAVAATTPAEPESE
jgi:prevent-host-death family protein